MAKKTVSKKEIALPLKWYEGEDPTPDELALYAEVYKSIGAIRQNLLIKQPFIGNVLLNLDLVLDLTIPTAATDFRNIYVNPKFWLLLDKGERLFTLAHETWHVALNHVLRRQGRLPEIWNIACDLEIHFVLLTEKFNEPWCLQHDPAWSTYSAEKIYDELMKNQPPRGGNGKDPNGNDDGNGNAPICVNPIPGGNQGTQNDKFGPTDRPFDGVIYDDPKPDGNDSDKDGNGNSVQRQGEWKPASEEPEKIDDFVRRIVNQAVIITQKNHGSVPGAVSGVIDEINNPVIPWREVLDAWATRVVDEWGHNTYKRLNRRTWSCGVILPSTEDKSINLVVAIDTSGSCYGPLVQQFFSELVGIMNSFDSYDLTVIQCNCQVTKVDHFTSDEPFDPSKGFEISGWGGTDFSPVFDYVEENELNPACLVYLTDGYGPAPDEAPDYPVLWVITEGGERPCPWGDAVSLTNDRVQ